MDKHMRYFSVKLHMTHTKHHKHNQAAAKIDHEMAAGFNSMSCMASVHLSAAGGMMGSSCLVNLQVSTYCSNVFASEQSIC